MFRDSDYKEPKLHHSYGSRPVPAMQQISQDSKFEDYRNEAQNNNAAIVHEIPTTWDTRYDPNNADSDWAGLVRRDATQRRHCDNHRSKQIGIEQTSDGIVSIEEKQEWPRKKHDNQKKCYNEGLISGIQDNEWKTTCQRQMEGESTTKDQLSIAKQAGPRRYLPDPAERRNEVNSFKESNNFSSNSRSSYLTNIGASLVNKIPEAPKSILDNNSSHITPIPGYTGRRPR